MLVRAPRKRVAKRSEKKQERAQVSLREWKLPEKAALQEGSSELHHVLPVLSRRDSVEARVKADLPQKLARDKVESVQKGREQENAYGHEGYTTTKNGLVYRDQDEQAKRKEYKSKESEQENESHYAERKWAGSLDHAREYVREQEREKIAYRSRSEQIQQAAGLVSRVEEKAVESRAEQVYIAPESVQANQVLAVEPPQANAYSTIDTKVISAPKDSLSVSPAMDFQVYSQKAEQASSMLQSYIGGTADRGIASTIESVKKEIGFKSMDCCREKLENRLAERLYDAAMNGGE